MISATKKFYVTDGPVPPNLGIANVNQAGYDPTDRQRLAIHYNPAAGRINLNAQNDMYGRSNIVGGDYSFDPNADYLNAGGWDDSHISPIKYRGSGLDNALTPATGAGGALFGNNLRVGIPRGSAGGSSSAGAIQCPFGFYQFNNVCVPGVNLDPTNPNNALGINTGNASYQEAKGVILQVIPPVKTQKGALFQVVTQIQNIGHKAGKFYTKVSVPMIGLVDIQSNGAFLAPGQKGVVYQSLQMPNTIPDQSLLMVKSDLYKQALDSPTAAAILQDSNEANLPNPSTVFGMPPPRPPIPNFPISTGNSRGFGYPYNPPQPGPQYPRPPPPPPGFSGQFSPYDPNPFGTPFGGAARANFGEQDFFGGQQPQQPVQFLGPPQQDPYSYLYGYPPQYGGMPGVNYMQDPYGYPPVPQQPQYDASQFNYQQYQYTGDPNYNPTPNPYPVYGDAASPIQQNMYYGNYQYPYQYQTPPPQQQQFDPSMLDGGPEIPDTPTPGFDTSGAQGGSISIGADGSIHMVGGGSSQGSGGTIDMPAGTFTGANNNDGTGGLGDSIRNRVSQQLQNSGLDTSNTGGSDLGNILDTGASAADTSGADTSAGDTGGGGGSKGGKHKGSKKHGSKSHSHSKKKKRKSRSHFAFGFGDNSQDEGYYAEPEIVLTPYSYDNTYYPGQRVSISAAGFEPGEYVLFQLYLIKSFLGTWRFTQKIGTAYARVDEYGTTNQKSLRIPKLSGRTMAMVAIGIYSGQKIHTKITVN